MPSLYSIKNTWSKNNWDNYTEYLTEKLGVFNETIFIFYILLHEYKHSLQDYNFILMSQKYVDHALTIDDV